MAASSVSRTSLSEQDNGSADDASLSSNYNLREIPMQDDLLNESWYNGTGPIPVSINHSKRERSQNWDPKEKCVLVELVRRRLAVVEDKAGDTDAVQRRKDAWRDIHAEFTAKIGGNVPPREVQRMREQWRRMKNWAKVEMITYQEACASTRGKDHASIPGQRRPNELAQYICRLMENYGSGYRFPTESQDADEPAARVETTEAYQDKNATDSISHEVVDLDAVPVKEEPDGVELLIEENHTSVPMATAPNFATSPPNPPLRHQPRRRENSRASSRKSTIPRWNKDFADDVPAPREDEDDDEDDDSDFLDSEDDQDFGSFSDWDAEPQPRQQHPLSQRPLPSHRGDPACAKVEKMRLTFARREFKRRMQMMEAEHIRKMQILDIHRETAQLKKKMAFRRLKQRRAPPPPASANLYGRQGHGHLSR